MYVYIGFHTVFLWDYVIMDTLLHILDYISVNNSLSDFSYRPHPIVSIT